MGTPSEHTIDAKQHEMEMHLVHINDDKEIAVLSFIFSSKIEKKHIEYDTDQQDEESDDMETDEEEEEEDQDDDQYDVIHENQEYDDDEKKEGNDFLAQFWDQLPLKKTKEDILLNKPLNFEYLLK